MGISDGYETVLVTGGTGFVAGHSIVQLLNLGYKVRTTVREIGRQEDLKLALRSLKLVDPSLVSENIAVFKADLLADDGWAEALYGCHYVLHLASPLPFEQPEDEEDQIIKLATEGTRRVLRFSRDAGVKKVVYTSSFAAIGYGHPDSKRLTESDWGSLTWLRMCTLNLRFWQRWLHGTSSMIHWKTLAVS